MNKLIWIALAVLSSTPAAAASFDCTKAQSKDEIAICKNAYLGEMDSLVSAAYATYEAEFQKKGAVAKAFLADRRACAGDEACIATVQSRMLETYGSAPPWVYDFAKALMARKAWILSRKGSEANHAPQIGECVVTRISSFTTRFGEPVTDDNADAGASIGFAAGVGQVSYDRDGLYGVKNGDRSVVCLMSRPHDCPDGDDRGIYYFTYDIDANAQWDMADAQHMCGGA